MPVLSPVRIISQRKMPDTRLWTIMQHTNLPAERPSRRGKRLATLSVSLSLGISAVTKATVNRSTS